MLPAILPLGPCELAFEAMEREEQLLAVRSLDRGDRLGELRVASAIIAEARTLLPDLEESHVDLFTRPFVSVLRYWSA